MSFVIKWILGKISPYLNIILASVGAVLISALLGVSYLYIKKVEENSDNALKVETLESQLGEVNAQITKEKERQAALVLERDKIRNDFNKFKSDVLNDKRDIADVVAQPEVERVRVQASYDAFLIDIRCLTGDASACQKPSK